MDLIKLSLPFDFISQRARLTWREILFGFNNELLAQGAEVDFALDDLAKDNPPDALLELASPCKGEPTRALVEQLAQITPAEDDEEIRGKWLYLVLAWIYEHKEMYPDPLQTVEEVYADFGYPERVADFVRYMPTNEPDLGSRELNEVRLYERWKRYLDDEGARIGAYRSRPG